MVPLTGYRLTVDKGTPSLTAMGIETNEHINITWANSELFYFNLLVIEESDTCTLPFLDMGNAVLKTKSPTQFIDILLTFPSFRDEN